MSHQNFHKLIASGWTPVAPGNPKVKELIDHKARMIAISKLPRKKGICKWCFAKKTVDNRHFYCSDECKLSVEIFCYPQQTWSRELILFRQMGVCAHCKYDFETRIKKRAYGYSISKGWETSGHKGYEKHVDYIDDMGEVDHIIPIHQGGTALGWDNLQILCRECHLKKSASERRKHG